MVRQIKTQMRDNGRGDPPPHLRLAALARVLRVVDHQIGLRRHPVNLGPKRRDRAGTLVGGMVQRNHVMDKNRNPPLRLFHGAQNPVRQVAVANIEIGKARWQMPRKH